MLGSLCIRGKASADGNRSIADFCSYTKYGLGLAMLSAEETFVALVYEATKVCS